jgi:short-subunit dehydrogenase
MPKENNHSGAVVITGASTGIGEACALFLDQKGFNVYAGVRKQADADALKQKASDRLTPLILDVTNAKQIAKAVEIVANAVGDAGIAGLVNNAGIAIAAPLEFVPLDRLRQQLEVNVVGLVAITQAFLPLLRQAKGRIINISSFGGTISSPILSPYNASKFALEALSDALRMELKPWGIDVAIIKPAAVKTPIWDKAIEAKSDLEGELPPQAVDMYGDAIDRIVAYSENANKRGASVDVVSKAIFHALIAEKPKTRYILATNRLIFTLLKLMPDRLRDYLILQRLGINKP